ncbi:QcrA and Rieske domain-containing protein [Cellulomonas palmilytica]|uniref:QcrA and Rieske domain-containing protein n=1 Tax=Cellulomonas palmilytica TaxID=2608402 RepID=UPI0021D5BCB7|nr:Rieske (2Fe-2S) protein [Cellulomonas palmilytica]UJP40474.1 Rieske (2Fe-2S) protein [Cellulomonas palmilytica]
MTSTTTRTPVGTTAPDLDAPTSHDHRGCAGCLDRRQLLRGAGGVTLAAAGAVVLAACGGSGSGDGTTTDGAGPGAGPGAEPGAGDGALAQVTDVPVGGALLVEADGTKILLVQETAGTITALSAICTHQGCTVQPADTELHCPCHGSTFQLDGTPVSGPAEEPLPAAEVHVEDGAVFFGAA